MSKNLINSMLRTFTPGKTLACGVVLASAMLQATATPVTVQEIGIDPAHETVKLTSSTLGSAWAYAGILDLKVNGVATDGFCIDPFHWSISGPQNYNSEPLAEGPKAPINGMGTATALEIEQLWAQFFSPTMSAQDAAGMQIAIWELVGDPNFKLDSASDYGAGQMLDWLNNNPAAPGADLIAVTGPGQDYVIPDFAGSNARTLPDGGATALMLGLAMAGLFVVRFKVLAPTPSK